MRTYYLTKLDGTPPLLVTQKTRPARKGYTVADSWPVNDPPPTSNDAVEWADFRTRQGVAGGH